MGRSHLYVEATGQVHELHRQVTTVGRGLGVDIPMDDRTVSPLHAEIVRRGPHVYVCDLGLSLNGTLVNGRPVGVRRLADGDVVLFGAARAHVGGVDPVSGSDAMLTRLDGRLPEITRRELDVLTALCTRAPRPEAFTTPASVSQIARELSVTEAAVTQHLLHLYAKLGVPDGPARRARLANSAIALGIVGARSRPPAAEPLRGPTDAGQTVRCPRCDVPGPRVSGRLSGRPRL